MRRVRLCQVSALYGQGDPQMIVENGGNARILRLVGRR
jgi:hypothetical protein